MKALKALWRFLTAPEFELWWSGFFLSQLIGLIMKYPHNIRTGWDMAYLALILFSFLYCTVRGFVCARKAAS